jgi:DNA (cytosine-5)-methyltransferase 1
MAIQPDNRKTFIEFFAGIGLVHAALRQEGWACIYANDISEEKRQMYEHYFGESSYYDVNDVWETDTVVSRITARPVLATASFPCTDLSLAGNRLGLKGEQSGSFYGFTKVLRALAKKKFLPDALLIENVMGFLSANKGEDFRSACKALSGLGYYLDVFTLDAKYFTPQSRARLFILGLQKEALPQTVIMRRKDEALLGTADREADSSPTLRPAKLIAATCRIELKTGWIIIPVNPPPQRSNTFRDIAEVGDDLDWWDDAKVEKHLAEMSQSHRQTIKQLILGTTETAGTIYRRVRPGGSRSEIRVDGLAGCLRTPRGGSSKQIVFLAGNGRLRMRWMTAREYARLQGADDFPIRVPRNQALFGFGDAVCVPAIRWIATQFLSHLPNKPTNQQTSLAA